MMLLWYLCVLWHRFERHPKYSTWTQWGCWVLQPELCEHLGKNLIARFSTDDLGLCFRLGTVHELYHRNSRISDAAHASCWVERITRQGFGMISGTAWRIQLPRPWPTLRWVDINHVLILWVLQKCVSCWISNIFIKLWTLVMPSCLSWEQ